LPAEIHQTATFDAWYRMTSQKDPNLLIMREEDVLAREASEVTAAQYPDSLQVGELRLPLTYHFEPGHPRDGVTVRVPAPLLPNLPGERLEWLVPGLLEAKCVALVRNLPKALRKNFVPVPDFVKASLARMTFGQGALPQALGQELLRMTGARVSDEAWAESVNLVEDHLRMNIEVVDGQGKFLGEGRDLAELTARFAAASQAALAVPRTEKSEQPVQAKAFSEVKQTAQQKIAGLSMTVYPALVEENGTVRERAFLDPGRSRVPAPPRLAAPVAAAVGGACQVPARQAAGVDRAGPAVPRTGPGRGAGRGHSAGQPGQLHPRR
jgi:ATP-dependent helicase HrpA